MDDEAECIHCGHHDTVGAFGGEDDFETGMATCPECGEYQTQDGG